MHKLCGTSAHARKGQGAVLFGAVKLRSCTSQVSMATGRGRPSCHRFLGLQEPREPRHGGGVARGRTGPAAGRAGAFRFRKGQGIKFGAGDTALRQYARHGQHFGKSSSNCSVYLDRMPSEILLKIFSYLDAVSLLCIGCVNRRFYHLANDNFIWVRIYSTAFSPKRFNWKVNSVEETSVSVSLLSVEDKEAGYWKKTYITKQITSVKATLAQILKPLSPYTGLPVKTKEALRISGLGWAIILKGKSGREYIMSHVDLSLNDTSITVMWYGKNWPRLATLSALNLCGTTPIFMERYKAPAKNGLRWHSLIAKYDLSQLTESTMIGCDRLIRIFSLSPGLVVGLWKKEEELAFVMANLHLHYIIERSTLGSATVPYELPPHVPFLDDNPEYGLHGYQLHIDMHGGGVFFFCATFYNLFTMKGCIEDGYVKLTAIHFRNSREHLPLIGKVGIAWRTNIFDAIIESCSFMDVTVLDEHRKPFWCLSAAVHMKPAACPSDGPHFLGQTYFIDYKDVEGRVHAELVWIEETEEYFIVSLVLYLSVAKINHWFGTKY